MALEKTVGKTGDRAAALSHLERMWSIQARTFDEEILEAGDGRAIGEGAAK